MLRRFASLACLTGLACLAFAASGCHPVHAHAPRPVHSYAVGRKTSFVPAPKIEGARLATDRAVKVTSADEASMTEAGAVKLGVLNVHVVDRLPPTENAWTEHVVWPGASIDAAALGATHARTLSVEAPLPRFDCGKYRNRRCETVSLTEAVAASYELWHVPPDRWADLPENLRPNPLPASAIRDVQPGNWVRPPRPVTVKSE